MGRVAGRGREGQATPLGCSARGADGVVEATFRTSWWGVRSWNPRPIFLAPFLHAVEVGTQRCGACGRTWLGFSGLGSLRDLGPSWPPGREVPALP